MKYWGGDNTSVSFTQPTHSTYSSLTFHLAYAMHRYVFCINFFFAISLFFRSLFFLRWDSNSLHLANIYLPSFVQWKCCVELPHNLLFKKHPIQLF